MTDYSYQVQDIVRAVQQACFDVGVAAGTLRDRFAMAAPEPTEKQIEWESQKDRNANPHNDSHKPRLRDTLEIIADLKYKYADAMLKARDKK